MKQFVKKQTERLAWLMFVLLAAVPLLICSGSAFAGYGEAAGRAVAQFVPAPPTPAPITRAAYQAARDRWQRQHIEAYELRVQVFAFGGVDMTLRVSDHGKQIEVLAPPEAKAQTPESLDYLKGYTVEGMFAEIEQFLQPPATPELLAGAGRPEFPSAYSGQFDPTLGYPISLWVSTITPPDVFVSDGVSERVISQLKILRRDPSTAP